MFDIILLDVYFPAKANFQQIHMNLQGESQRYRLFYECIFKKLKIHKFYLF